jgi:hypothetical protein
MTSIETQMRDSNIDHNGKFAATRQFKLGWGHKTLLFIFIVSSLISAACIFLLVGFLMGKVLNFDAVGSFLASRDGYTYRILIDYPWIIVVSFLITIIGLVRINGRKFGTKR